MRDIKDELLAHTNSRPIIKIERNHLILFVVVLFFALYIYFILYGGNSILRLYELKDENQIIKEKIAKMTEENAKIKQYIYELKVIKGEE